MFLLPAVLLSTATAAALPAPPEEDIHFLAEHLPEAAQDARYLALPLLRGPLQPGRWQWTVEAGAARAEAGFLRIQGPMLAVSAGYAWSDRSALSVLGFGDTMRVSGDRGPGVLGPSTFAAVPLDLPETAEFSNARGDYRHWGLGAGLTRVLRSSRFQATGGLLYDRLSLRDYALDYRILGGASAGTTGVVDHSGTASFLTPFVAIQYTHPLGARWALTPRAVGAFPLPAGDFDSRLTGPGFDLSTARGDASPGRIGDAVLGFGMGLLHERSGLELDVGGLLFYPLFERVSHKGIDRALTLQLSWHF